MGWCVCVGSLGSGSVSPRAGERVEIGPEVMALCDGEGGIVTRLSRCLAV